MLIEARELFTLARTAADDCARCKRWLIENGETLDGIGAVDYSKPTVTGGTSDVMARVDSYIDRAAELRRGKLAYAENVLDGAWSAVGFVCNLFSDECGHSLASHYLGGYSWADVADELGYGSHSTAIERAEIALDWLESNYRIDLADTGEVAFTGRVDTEAI